MQNGTCKGFDGQSQLQANNSTTLESKRQMLSDLIV